MASTSDRREASSVLAATPDDAIWTLAPEAAAARLGSRLDGLTSAEAADRLRRLGPNAITEHARSDAVGLLVRQFSSPIVLILVVATILSGVLGDAADAAIIVAIILLSGVLGFWQERGATRAVDALLALVRVDAEVRRDGALTKVPLEAVVRGDVVRLRAGDLIPGDALVADSTSLLVDEAALTGETYPVDKAPGTVPATAAIATRTNALFMGTHVVSGSGTAIVIATGRETRFGQISARVGTPHVQTGFERGMTEFGVLLVRVVIVLLVAIFVVNVILQRPLIDAALFSLALAVGLTPQLLPAIVTISLSQGARLMARRRVIVKRLDAIEDFGAMSVLCTDKTGTMTVGQVVLEGALDLAAAPSDRVAHLARLNARFQTGFENPIDQAILAAPGPSSADDTAAATRLAELPYDFDRKRLSVLVKEGTDHRLITKGALDDVLAVCSKAETPAGSVVDLQSERGDIETRYRALSAQGYRVLGIAMRDMGGASGLVADDERDLVFVGFLSFLDPPKSTAATTVRDLAAAGISVRMITGDNRLVAAHVGGLVGLDGSAVLTGEEIDALDDDALPGRVADTRVFAEIEPLAKERIIRALRATGRVVGYLGDGINDGPALHAADVGISVDTAVPVAKEAAAIVLLDKDLEVLLDGVRQGRRTFANTMKYVQTTTSANFGNVLSMAIASAVLPFLPLLASQILLINFLTDIPATTIATDEVDPERLETPHSWDIGFVRAFMIVFGGVSTAFDLLTFVVLRLGFSADATLFRSGWFIESTVTELAVLFVLRTRRSFLRSRPSTLLLLSSAALAVVAIAIPYSPLAGPLDLTGPPPDVLGALVVITAGYVLATELAKRVFYRRVAPAT